MRTHTHTHTHTHKHSRFKKYISSLSCKKLRLDEPFLTYCHHTVATLINATLYFDWCSQPIRFLESGSSREILIIYRRSY